MKLAALRWSSLYRVVAQVVDDASGRA